MDSQTITSIAIVVVAIIAFVIYLVWQIKKKGLREFAITSILRAEELFEHGQNNDKMKYVVKSLKEVIEKTNVGKMLSMFITEQNIEDFIQSIFDGIKRALDYVPKKGE